MSTSSAANASSPNTSAGAGQETTFSVRPYKSCYQFFPYTPTDFSRADESEDENFYSSPRFVTHIDDHAISVLKKYYSAELPQRGRILDLCSSWISHFPPELGEKARRGSRHAVGEIQEGGLEVVGIGMNKRELDANPILSERVLQNLNTNPRVPEQVGLNATVCVVSIDYLTRPVEVLSSIYRVTMPYGSVHLVVSNRCFPTKAVGRWLRVGEQERLDMVAEYLWWSGWRGIEIVELCDGVVEGGEQEPSSGAKALAELMRSVGVRRVDPLWVVRGRKIAGE